MISNTATRIDGSTIIFFYDLFVLAIFLLEFFLYSNLDRLLSQLKTRKDEGNPINGFKGWSLKLLEFYDRHGIITVDALLMIIIVITGVLSQGVNVRGLLLLVISLGAFSVLMFFGKRLLVGLNQFENAMVGRCIDAVSYLIIGHAYVNVAGFIAMPDIALSLAGLLVALLLCFVVMVQAIINPMVLIRPARRAKNHDALGMLKGMGVLTSCVLVILYLMVYTCWKTNPAFYTITSGGVLDPWDLLYYLFVSFSTIGYGDIVPMRVDGLFYSRLVAIIIAGASLFTTACFVGAVVAGANGSAAEEGSKDSSRN